MPRRVLFSFFFTLLLSIPAKATTCLPSDVYLVRHAEKETAPTLKDPPLTSAGQSRALALAAKLAQTPLSIVYTTRYARTQATAQPVVTARHLPLQEYDAKVPEALLAKLMSAHCGKQVLIIGHSNTVPDLLTRLGAQQAPSIPETQYGDFFHLHYTGEQSRPTLVRDHYGN